jgi:hypothetical protein
MKRPVTICITDTTLTLFFFFFFLRASPQTPWVGFAEISGIERTSAKEKYVYAFQGD